MTKTFKTSEEALVYMTECTLATIEGMAMKKNPPKGELARQMSIADSGLTFIRKAGISYTVRYSSRIKDVIEDYDGSIFEWFTACSKQVWGG